MKRNPNRVRKHNSKVPVRKQSQKSSQGRAGDALNPVQAKAAVHELGVLLETPATVKPAWKRRLAAAFSALHEALGPCARVIPPVPAAPFALRIRHAERVIDIMVDEYQAELLERAAAILGLTIKDIFEYLIYRQTEAWSSAAADDCSRVWGGASKQIEISLNVSREGGVSLKRIIGYLVQKIQDLQPSDLSGGSAQRVQLLGLCDLLMDTARDVESMAEDAEAYWSKNVVPALLERIPVKGQIARVELARPAGAH